MSTYKTYFYLLLIFCAVAGVLYLFDCLYSYSTIEEYKFNEEKAAMIFYKYDLVNHSIFNSDSTDYQVYHAFIELSGNGQLWDVPYDDVIKTKLLWARLKELELEKRGRLP